MILLLAFSFLAGVITVLSPCILPILPIILTSSIGGHNIGKSRAFGVVTGFVLSFTFFTLFLSTIVRLSGIPADSLRFLSIIIIAGFGISFLIPKFQSYLEILFSKMASFMPKNQNRTGFVGGLVIGFSIGLLWTPCVGPILASVISLAIIGTVTFDAFLITLAYSLGTAIPMFLIILGGQNALRRVPFLLSNLSNIQKIFGVIMIITAIGIFFNIDRKFQSFILDKFPQYGIGLTKLEDNEAVRKELDRQNMDSSERDDMGKPMFDVLSPKGIKAPELIPGGSWLNSEPLRLSELRGKVVLIDFWTYSCINCQRTFPYLKDWWSKYEDHGLVIIGVHSPEFEFEKSDDNLRKAAEDFGLTYPIVQDNEFSTWRAYNNRYWPAKYLIDKEGYVRYTHFGEGAYDETEGAIQDLLEENTENRIGEKINNPEYEVYSRTPETYLGYLRMEGLASPEKVREDQFSSYTVPSFLPNNHFSLNGEWEITEEYAQPREGTSLEFNFEAKEVFLVMRKSDTLARIRVSVDGKTQFQGADVRDGVVTLDTDRLYKLVNLDSPGRHILKLEFLDGNSQLFAFTFG